MKAAKESKSPNLGHTQKNVIPDDDMEHVKTVEVAVIKDTQDREQHECNVVQWQTRKQR